MKRKVRLRVLMLILAVMAAWNVPIGPATNGVRAANDQHSARLVYGSLAGALANGKIAYVMERRENNSSTYTIHLIDADGSNHVQATSGPNDSGPVWSPDGLRIAFTRGQASDQRYEIFVMNGDGSDQTSLTPSGESDSSPAWSPDGTQLVFARRIKEGKTSHAQIFTMNADGSDQRRLSHSEESEGSPIWCPDGGKIAFLRFSEFGNKLVIANSDGSDERIVGRIVSGFSWSPDGSKLAVGSYEIGLFAVNSDGTGLRTLTYPPAYGAYDIDFDSLPAWSPDGSRIAYTRYLGCNIEEVDCKGAQIWQVNADGSNPRQLTGTSSATTGPSWSPDGLQILSNDSDLVVIDPSNGGMTNITNTFDATEFSASWQPIPVIGCADLITPADASFEADGGTGNIEVGAANDCRWTAVTNAAWISITSVSGSGKGSVSYSVAANNRTGPRRASVIVAGHLVAVTQAGVLVRIFAAQVTGKQLLILGEHFDPGAAILLNGIEQNTKSDLNNPTTTLISKKAGKNLRPGDKLQVRNPNGSLSQEFFFVGQ